MSPFHRGRFFFTPCIKFLRTNSSFVGMIFESEMGFQPLAVCWLVGVWSGGYWDGLYELVAELWAAASGTRGVGVEEVLFFCVWSHIHTLLVGKWMVNNIFFPPPLLNTERYRVLPCPAAQLKFLILQRELVDDFRIRLTQVSQTTRSNSLLLLLLCSIILYYYYYILKCIL